MARRLPLALKLGFTAWMLAWAPSYAAHYGAQNFLWFCDIGNFAIAAALWMESRLLFSSQAVSLLLVQTLYTIDLAGRAVLGTHVMGGTEYMFDPSIPLGVRLLSLFHVATPPLLVWALLRLGYDRRAFACQTVTAWALLPVSWLFGPVKDINWTWGPFDRPQDALHPVGYLFACMLAYPLLLYLPSHLALSRLIRTGRGGGTRIPWITAADPKPVDRNRR